MWPHSDILGDQVTQFKASNVKFLMQHGFDFNKLFKDGISYLRPDDVQRLRSEMEERHAKYDEIRENSLNSSFSSTPKSR